MKSPGKAAGKLRLTNGYAIDFDQLARLLDASCRDSRLKIPKVELASAVGVADSHVQFLCSIAHALGIMGANNYKPTPLGRLIRENDGFFDDNGTLWCLHYIASSNPENIAWNRFVTTILPADNSLTLQQFRDCFDDLRSEFAESSYARNVNQETRTLLDAYTNQNLSRLAYLRKNGEQYTLGYREPIPALVVAASIARFRDRHRPGDTAIPVSDLIAGVNSPGVVFQLSEERLRSTLEELKMQQGFSLESRADLDQVRLMDDKPDHIWMERYYASR